MTPGSSIIASPELRCRHGLRRDLSSSALPILPAIRFTRGKYFGASRFTHLLRPAKLLAPLYGSDRHARPPGAFTSRLPTDRLPSPLLDMTTTATGLLCWRDFHPLEWQLTSLHQIRTCGFPAYGSHLACVTAKQTDYCPAIAPITMLSSAGHGSRAAAPDSWVATRLLRGIPADRRSLAR